MTTSMTADSSALSAVREISPAIRREQAPRAAMPVSAPDDTAPKPGRPNRLVWLAVPAAALLITAVVAYFVRASHYEETDNSFIEGRVHQVSSRVTGTVAEVLVGDFETVKAGQPLFRLDPRDAEFALREARTQLAQAEAGISQAETMILQARAQAAQAAASTAQAAAQQRKAALDFDRARSLFEQPTNGNKVISKADFDGWRAALDIANASVAAASATSEAAVANVRSAEAGVAVAQARRDTAAAAVATAELQASYTTITAPVAGRLGKRGVEVGQRVSPGQALLALVGEERWVIANFKENQLSQMQAGQSVTITVDAIKDRKFEGRVESFSGGTGARFALLPPDNATGNFTKIVQRLPVKIVFQPESVQGFADRLRPGLSTDVEVTVK